MELELVEGNVNESTRVYVSCAEHDLHWLYEEVVPRIEDQWGYTTFSRQRDLNLGAPRTASIASLNSANVCLCIISPHFCDDGICLWELAMMSAKDDKSVLFFCKENINPNEYSYISTVTSYYNHIEYNPSRADGEMCWDKLHQFIQSKINNE